MREDLPVAGKTHDEFVAALREENEIEQLKDQELKKKYSNTFIGTFSHSLDSKGRIIVPIAFREGLGETFCIGPSFNFKSIVLYPELVWIKTREKYEKLGSFNSTLMEYLEMFDAFSYRGQECDAQGRVLLPVKIRQMILGNEKEVEIAGAKDCVRVVARPNFDKQVESFMDRLPDILATLNQLG
ncbi:MAG: hypothetical protein Q4C54_09280 [Clostridia bacterium]|nr:hypothetical protein [Clostridia bacterium]